ncbi:MAG: hypothetical protein AAGC46_00440 [Solirubrobacteraceae bacterium]
MGLSDHLPDLERVIEPAGFALQTASSTEQSSGGPFEQAVFARDDRRLRLWLRRTSLSVGYSIGTASLDHAEYMRELLGPRGGNRFPAYADDASRAFEAFVSDLVDHCDDFLRGDGAAFARFAASAAATREASGFDRLRAVERRLRPG